MRRLHFSEIVLAAAVAAALPALAKANTGPAGANDPLNAVVKLEFTTTKPDIFCPWANRTDGGTRDPAS